LTRRDDELRDRVDMDEYERTSMAESFVSIDVAGGVFIAPPVFVVVLVADVVVVDCCDLVAPDSFSPALFDAGRGRVVVVVLVTSLLSSSSLIVC
jgi:hypothetical protein